MSSTATASSTRARTAKMRAAVVTSPRTMLLTNLAVPAPSAGQVLIRLEGSGVCGSDVPLWEGREWFTYPREPGAPGHEGWGVVAAIGDGVTDVAHDDRVAALSYHAYAEYDLANALEIVRLPASLRAVPVPAEPVGCAMNVFRRSDITAGQTVAIVGIGFLGAVLTQLAVAAGARVIAVSRRPFALEIAHACGADELVPMLDHQQIIQNVMRLTDGLGCDRVIEAVGTQWPLDLAGELTRERGRLIIAGFHQDGLRQVNMFLWNWRGLDVINAHERDPAASVEGMRAAVAALDAGVLDLEPLYTHRLPLQSLDRAMTLLRERPDGFLKALVIA